MSIRFPQKGYIFWPVGNGDSTTIVVDDETIIQVDLNHLSESDEDDDPHTPIIENLIDNLPEINDKPFLSVFVLTHPDQDHCRGFADLLEEVRKIRELLEPAPAPPSTPPKNFYEEFKDFFKEI